jgi:hypothetical protein
MSKQKKRTSSGEAASSLENLRKLVARLQNEQDLILGTRAETSLHAVTSAVNHLRPIMENLQTLVKKESFHRVGLAVEDTAVTIELPWNLTFPKGFYDTDTKTCLWHLNFGSAFHNLQVQAVHRRVNRDEVTLNIRMLPGVLIATTVLKNVPIAEELVLTVPAHATFDVADKAYVTRYENKLILTLPATPEQLRLLDLVNILLKTPASYPQLVSTGITRFMKVDANGRVVEFDSANDGRRGFLKDKTDMVEGIFKMFFNKNNAQSIKGFQCDAFKNALLTRGVHMYNELLDKKRGYYKVAANLNLTRLLEVVRDDEGLLKVVYRSRTDTQGPTFDFVRDAVKEVQVWHDLNVGARVEEIPSDGWLEFYRHLLVRGTDLYTTRYANYAAGPALNDQLFFGSMQMPRSNGLVPDVTETTPFKINAVIQDIDKLLSTDEKQKSYKDAHEFQRKFLEQEIERYAQLKVEPKTVVNTVNITDLYSNVSGWIHAKLTNLQDIVNNQQGLTRTKACVNHILDTSGLAPNGFRNVRDDQKLSYLIYVYGVIQRRIELQKKTRLVINPHDPKDLGSLTKLSLTKLPMSFAKVIPDDTVLDTESGKMCPFTVTPARRGS